MDLLVSSLSQNLFYFYIDKVLKIFSLSLTQLTISDPRSREPILRFGINSIIDTDDRTNKILNENFECHKVGYGSKDHSATI